MSQRRRRRAGLASAAVTVLALAVPAAPAFADVLPVTFSSPSGPSGGGSMIFMSLPGSTGPFVPGTTPTIQFQYAGNGDIPCDTAPKAPTQITVSGMTTTAGALTVDPTTIRRISFTRVAFEVPSSVYPVLDENGNNSTINTSGLVLLGEQVSSPWNVCVYDSESLEAATLLAAGSYTLVRKPVITSIIPAASPAGGGQLITVNGTGFKAVSAPITASIGGASLTDVTVAPSGNSFTAITGPRAAGNNLPLMVDTPGGTVSSLDPDNNGLPQDGDYSTPDAPIPFVYTRGISVTPNTGAVGKIVNVEASGAGFTGLTFDNAGSPTDGLAHLFLVDGVYESASNRGVAECWDVLVISDTQLICTLDLSGYRLDPSNSSVTNSPIDDGAYFLTLVETGDVSAGPAANATVMSSGSAFIVAPY